MTRWKLTIEYDGTHFSGWQKQLGAISVQQILEQAIEKFCQETVTLHVSGRTDAGVHARAQVAHMDLAKPTDATVIRDALNFHVRPHRIIILQVEAVADRFHARFDAKERNYRYIILNRRAPPALMKDRVWHVPRPLSVSAMHEAAQLLIGKHDFSTFRAQHCQSKSPIRTLERLDVTRDGDLITIEAQARSFLYHQVRNMVGTLVMVGSGRWSLEDFHAAFLALDRARGGPTAPPEGLYFWDVTYPQQ